MGLGAFHKKKKKIINFVKINFLSLVFFRKKTNNFNNRDFHSCLIIHDNSKLGDLIVLSSLYREFDKFGIKLSILTTESGKAFLCGNPKIHHFFIKKSNKLKDVMSLRKQLSQHSFDIVIDPFETMPSFTHSLILSGVKDSHILGFDKWYKRYYSFYHPHDEKLNAHMSTRATEILSFYFGDLNKKFDISYDLPVSEHIEKSVLDFIGGDKIIVINALGAKKICRLTDEQINVIYYHLKDNYPQYRVIFTGLEQDVQSIAIPEKEALPFKEFIYTVALTKFSRYVVSVDTALIHVASAWHIPTLALYPNARHISYPSHLIWAPNNSNALQVVSPGFMVKDISNDKLVSSIDALLGRH